MPSPLWPIDEALSERLLTHEATAPLLAAQEGVWAGQAQGSLPYVVLGTPDERPFRMFGKMGHNSSEELHIWSKRNKREVMQIYSAMEDALKAPLALDDHMVVRVELEFILYFVDPSDRSLHHGVSRVTVLSQETVAP